MGSVEHGVGGCCFFTTGAEDCFNTDAGHAGLDGLGDCARNELEGPEHEFQNSQTPRPQPLRSP